MSSKAIALVEIKDNPIPENSKVATFMTKDGFHIRYATFKTSSDNVKGCICLFTGRSEFIEKYFETIKSFQIRGFDVAIMDWRGQGLSDRLMRNRRAGHITNFKQYVSDAQVFMEQIVYAQCRGPYFAVAHSMGGNIITQLLAEKSVNPYFKRALIISPLYQFNISNFKFDILKALANGLALLGLGKLRATILGNRKKEEVPFEPDNLISSSEKRMKRERDLILANLDLAMGPPTFGWLSASTKAIWRLRKREFLQQITTPMMVLMGTSDFLVSQKAMEKKVSRISGAGLVKIHGGRHELLMENDALLEEVWAAIDSFIPGTYRVDQDDQFDSAFS